MRAFESDDLLGGLGSNLPFAFFPLVPKVGARLNFISQNLVFPVFAPVIPPAYSEPLVV